jgi:hypothetical protein
MDAGEENHARGVHWRRGDHKHNLAQAERLLNSAETDVFIVAFDLLGWRLVGPPPAV